MSTPAATARAVVASVPSRRSSDRQVEDLPDGGLAAGAQEDGPAEVAERGQAGQQLEVLLGGLAEADARVDDELLAMAARRDGPVDGPAEVRHDLADDVPVLGAAPGRA